jgi:hypothetical protein
MLDAVAEPVLVIVRHRPLSPDDFSQKEGVSLNQFINVAVAEKLAHLQHEEWLARRSKVTSSSIAKALQMVDRPTRHAPEEKDKLPKGYVSIRRKYAGKRVGAPRKG